VKDQPTAAETTDPEGRQVVLADAVWRKKIVRDHPEIDRHVSDVLQTVTKPDHVAADPIVAARTRYYARGVGPGRWLLVVVSYEQVPARIVSAFANRKDPRSWSA
jgi:sarcosine oxidase gamma subunit